MSEQGETNGQKEAGGERWLDRHLWQIQPVRDVLVLLAVFGVFWLGYKLSVVTVPLLLAITLAYLFEPVIKWATQREWVSRQGAVAGIIGACVLVIVVPLVIGLSFAAIQGVQLAGELATTANQIKEAIENPDDQYRQDQVDGRIPIWIVDTVLEARERELAEQLQAEQDAEAATGDESGEQPTDESETAGVPESIDPDPSEEVLVTDGTPAETEVDTQLADSGIDEGESLDEGTTRRQRRPRTKEEEQIDSAMMIVVSWVEANANALVNQSLQTGQAALQTFVGFVSSVFYIGFTLFLTAFFFFFIANSFGNVLEFGKKFIPEDHADTTLDLLKKFDAVIAGFVRGRLTIAFIQSIVFSVGYWIIGVPAPVLLGVAVAVLSIVPYAALVGIPISIILLWLESRTGIRGSLLWTVGAPVIFYFIGQALDDYVWTPLIQGKSTGMDTPTILFATLAGGALMGVYGLLLAIPLAACIKILLQEIFWPRFQDWIAGKRPDFLPINKD
ncbi:MAG: hypothetical protein Phyf2KO_20860 [Phycisphaerales bacterium]